ncbi:hypothetical protein ACFFWB_26720 [Flavobacterium procerum]|uniref:hypothetical protein n=1 Tax=Flavobacterium procerum TaxID=1455569 RepID=UPI0035E66647
METRKIRHEKTYGAEVFLEWKTKKRKSKFYRNGIYAFSKKTKLIWAGIGLQTAYLCPYHKLKVGSYNWTKFSLYFNTYTMGEVSSTPFKF